MFTSNYGFNVDYLAEILKEFRKEDRMNNYTRFFTLSDTLTTRDKTSIAKTFSGLVKVIFPNGEFTEEDARFMIEFAIECRKRVKDQIRQMDDTFEKVDFSYLNKQSGKRIYVPTLEYLEHKDLLGLPLEEFTEEMESVIEITSSPSQKMELLPGQRIIRDNQSGITYDLLFGPYLEGATEITLTDPYIRLPYQLRNLMEFAKLINSRKNKLEEVRFHLITNNDEEYLQTSKVAFEQIKDSLETLGILFSYEFNENTHDRSIVMDNGWKIVLGRGLDIFQKTNGWYDIAEYSQEKRICKACEVTYVEFPKKTE